MKWYAFHVGDYASRTSHLSDAEDLAYRRMLDLYYAQGGPLPLDVGRVARLVRMAVTPDVVESVLKEFFQAGEDGWHNRRCDEELVRGETFKARAKTAAERRWSRNASGMLQASNKHSSSTPQALPKHDASMTQAMPPTPTPTPDEQNIRAPRSARALAARPEDVTAAVWDEFAALRKLRRATLTETVVAGIRREAKAAGMTIDQALRTCIERGWQGFKADWVKGRGPVSIADIDYGTEQVQDL